MSVGLVDVRWSGRGKYHSEQTVGGFACHTHHPSFWTPCHNLNARLCGLVVTVPGYRSEMYYVSCEYEQNLYVDRLCGLVVRVPGYRTEMYYVSCEYEINLYVDHLCGLMVRVPGYRTEMYCVSCEVRTEFIYVM
jgi:hypothetical protein